MKLWLIGVLLLGGPSYAGDMDQGGGSASASDVGISTGVTATAAFTGNGNNPTPLGINSSSVPVFNANRNLSVPYGVIGGTGNFTNINIDSGTVTTILKAPQFNADGATGGFQYFKYGGAITGLVGLSNVWEGGADRDLAIAVESGKGVRFFVNGSGTRAMYVGSNGFVAIGPQHQPAARLHLSSATFLINGNGPGISLANEVEGTSGANFVNLSMAGYGSSGQEWVGNKGGHPSINGAANVQLLIADSVETMLRANGLTVDANGSAAVSAITANGLVVNPPAAQTIAAGNIITADSCGGLKEITAAGAVTTDTTNTFTAPAAGNRGCCMSVINIGSNAITLDNNALFVSAGAADVVLGAGDTVRVCSTGASGAWYQIGATGNN